MMAANVSTTYLNISGKPNPIRKKYREVATTNFASQNCCCQQLKNQVRSQKDTFVCWYNTSGQVIMII